MSAMTVQIACALVVMTLGTQAHADTVVPMKGQTRNRFRPILRHARRRRSQPTTRRSPLPTRPRLRRPQPIRSRPADKRAALSPVPAAGAAAAEVRGNQYGNYDKVDSDVQKEYRQDQAQDAAVAGAVVGGFAAAPGPPPAGTG